MINKKLRAGNIGTCELNYVVVIDHLTQLESPANARRYLVKFWAPNQSEQHHSQYAVMTIPAPLLGGGSGYFCDFQVVNGEIILAERYWRWDVNNDDNSAESLSWDQQ